MRRSLPILILALFATISPIPSSASVPVPPLTHTRWQVSVAVVKGQWVEASIESLGKLHCSNFVFGLTRAWTSSGIELTIAAAAPDQCAGESMPYRTDTILGSTAYFKHHPTTIFIHEGNEQDVYRLSWFRGRWALEPLGRTFTKVLGEQWNALKTSQRSSAVARTHTRQQLPATIAQRPPLSQPRTNQPKSVLPAQTVEYPDLTSAHTPRLTAPENASAAEEPTTQRSSAPQPLRAFTVEADDSGLYPATISAKAGERVHITFYVRVRGVYFGGLDFRGPMFYAQLVPPAGTETVEFTMPDNAFTYGSFWPRSSIQKAVGHVILLP